MIKAMLHRIVANPRVYNIAQRLIGARYVHRQIDAQVAPVRDAALVLDLGGGTGINRDLWPPTSAFICLDTDPVKLHGFLRKHPHDIPLLGDATCVPLKADSVDVVLCAAVSHHLPDDALPSLFVEGVRSLKPGGRFIFLDAVWIPSRPMGRLLWKYDRGSYPRTKETLKALIAGQCEIVHWREFRLFHTYVLCVGTKAEARA
jgi:SAM-dependent methyltransferase